MRIIIVSCAATAMFGLSLLSGCGVAGEIQDEQSPNQDSSFDIIPADADEPIGVLDPWTPDEAEGADEAGSALAPLADEVSPTSHDFYVNDAKAVNGWAVGRDENQGDSPARPWATLQKANDYLVATYGKDGQRANPIVTNIYIRNGARFENQRVAWGYTNNGNAILIHTPDDSGAQPKFVGCTGNASTCDDVKPFFAFYKSNKKTAPGTVLDTRVVLKNLNITRYFQAINMQGNPDRDSEGQRYNAVRGCTFSHIGTRGMKAGTKFSPSIIQWVNQKSGSIVDNKFLDSALQGGCGGQGVFHVTYVTHHSKYNDISHNTVTNVSGDFHLRDDSGHNAFTYNTIRDSMYYAVVTEWRCRYAGQVENCTRAEAASDPTTVEGNKSYNNYSCGTCSAWHDPLLLCMSQGGGMVCHSTSGTRTTAAGCVAGPW